MRTRSVHRVLGRSDLAPIPDPAVHLFIEHFERKCAGAQHDIVEVFKRVGVESPAQCGFRTFSRMKPVFRQARFNLVGLLNPPYGGTFRWMLRLLLGRRGGRPPFTR